MESPFCKSCHPKNCTILASLFMSPCFFLTMENPTPLGNSLRKRTPVLFSRKRRNFWKKRYRNIRWFPRLRRRRNRHPPCRQQHNGIRITTRKEICHPEPSGRRISRLRKRFRLLERCFASLRMALIVKVSDARPLYSCEASNRHCSTSATVTVGRAQRIAQIELKPTVRNGKLISSTKAFFFSATSLA